MANTNKLTQKIVREYVRILGGSFKRTEFDDFRLKFGQDEYFTNGLDDIIGTARVMQGSNGNIEQAEEYLTACGVDADMSLQFREGD